jgi:butyryl-CoA dehydrogenase
MPTYRAPLRDMRFVLNELADPARLRALPGCEELTDDLLDPVLEEAAKLCEEVLTPINRSGDEEGCALENGVVRTPKGLPGGLRRLQGGRLALAELRPRLWRQGLPRPSRFSSRR